MEDYRLEQTGQEVQRILNGAAMEANLQAEVERATDAEGTLQGNIDSEERARQDADGLLQQGISDEENRAKRAEEANAGEIEGIKALIPSTATSDNKLADTNYVNSSIQTATAEYRGDYNVVTDLHLAIDATHAQIETLLGTVIAEADKNDYCYVMIPTNASTPTEIAKIERYKMTSEGWKFEYDVNNSTFTAEEWAAIKSGITSGLVAKLNALPTNADLLLLLAGKQDVLTFDATPVPESNNPVKSGGVYSAIDDEKTARLNSDTAIHTELDGLQAKVPATASSDNKLVDQNQMNSSISTATATYRGDWNVVSDLHLAVDATSAQIAALLPTVISTADNNDYCYVEIPTSAETPTQIERVERYKFNGTAWGYEYVLNNSGFTAAQWAAINSMITSGLVAKLSALPTNADLLAMLAQKQDNLTFDSTPTENSTNPVTSGGVFAADKALSDAIEAILLLIPSAASALNKLVDTALLNSSISTATATFRGTYNLVSNLGLGIDATEGEIAAALSTAISTADNNDYAFVQIPTSAETPAQIARTDRYKFNGTAWAFEYTLNTSGFTAAQWAAINSTITSALVAKLNALPTAAELQEALGVFASGITAINQKIPSTATQSNKLVDNASMESYISQVINILDASFNVTSTDGHITLHITQVDGIITSVQVQSSDIASAADLALKASQADLTALASRVTTAEGNITSLTGRMGTAETNITNLQQLYNNLQQSKPVPVTALPSTGQQQGVIYRLAGTTSYSDYMWDGSSWVLMATYNNAIDDVPTAGSNNLVKSGGVKTYVDDSISIDHSLDLTLYAKIPYNTQRGDGKWHYDAQQYGSILIPRKDIGSYIRIGTTATGSYCQYFFLKDDQNIADNQALRLCDNTSVITISTVDTVNNVFIPEDCGYLCLYRSNWSDQVFINTDKIDVYSPSQSLIVLNSRMSVVDKGKNFDVSKYMSLKIPYNLQNNDGLWHSDPNYGTILFPVEYFGLFIKIGTTNVGEYCQYFFLTDNDNITNGAVPHLCKNTEKVTITSSNTTYIEHIPSDCKYVAVYVSNWSEQKISSDLFLQDLSMIEALKLTADDIFNKGADENGIYPCYLTEEQFLISLKFSYIPSSTFSPDHSFYNNVMIAQISDVHADAVNYLNYIEFFNQHKELINTALVTGDIADVYESDGIETISNESELDDGLTIYKAVGNHEAYCTSEKESIYDMFNVDTNTGELYYNIDYIDQKIKLIVLNQYDYDDSITSEPAKSRAGRWTQEQIDWFIQQLQSALTNEYAVIIALHDAWELGVPARNNMSFYQENDVPIDNTSATSSPIIAEIVNAFQFGGSLNKTYSFSDTSYTVSVNTSFASRGTFIAYISGHYHVDRIGYSKLYPYQLVIAIQGAVIEGISRSDAVAHWSSMYDTPRRLSTVTANSINLYCIDTKNRLLKIAKIGSNLTYKLKPRMFAVFKY